MNYEEISFKIISYAGEALAQMKEAVEMSREKNFEGAEQKMKEASATLGTAHEAHTEVILAEARGEKCEYSFLLTHAQDIMMNSMLFETIAEEFITFYKLR